MTKALITWCLTFLVIDMKLNYRIFVALVASFIALGASSCSRAGHSEAAQRTPSDTFVERGTFSADSAMAYAAAQVAFGPRVPGTEAHARCMEWLVGELRRLGADTVRVIESQAEAWNGKTLPVRNIFAQFNPDATSRIILLAHYDTRPWADQEEDESARDIPIDGANDGASGVAVLLEIARQLGQEPAALGVDILLTDCEDYGARSDSGQASDSDSWCLGSQHFAGNLPYAPGSFPRFGILLDMVGGRDARFHREYLSASLAPAPTAKVWDMARKLGLGSRFPMQVGGACTDDHLPLIRAGIPVTDIIENQAASTGAFPITWHTHDDGIENLDPASMEAVGRVTLNVVYNEKN